MISLSRVSFRYPSGDFVLEVPELDIAAGEQVAVIGPSGSGKTTLLDLMAGISVPASGSVVVDGVDLATLADASRRDLRVRRIGLVFQELELLDYLSVLDNVLLPYRINATLDLTRPARDRAVELAREMGLDGKLGRLPGQLSQGERQRVAVCRALVPGPPVLLADEPTGNLDPANKGRVLDLLLGRARAARSTLVAVTHDHGLLGRFDRVVEFKDLVAGEAD
jgi:ABC-type lipoprotein export system ATPase subunit